MIHLAIDGALGAGANLAVYAANNQIIDGMASDYALKIEPNGLLTIKNLEMINFDFVAQINQLINQVNLLQQSIGTTEQDITDIKNDIDTINQELSRQTHFRGYYLLNSEIQNLPNSANGDLAFSAESGTVWMFDAAWDNIGDIVSDQFTPANDAIPQMSIVSGNAGVSTEYARGDLQHPLQVSIVQLAKDTATGENSVATTYARSDHTHHVNLSNNVPKKDTGTGTAGSSNLYARSEQQHPLNIDPTTANVPLVNATAAANGTSDYNCRNYHVHPQQLTYDGNVTAIKFIKTGRLATEVLCANGDATTINSKFFRTYNGSAGGWIRLCVFAVGASVDQYLIIRTSNTDAIAGQWSIFTPPSNYVNTPLGFVIVLASEANDNTRGLRISADGNTLTFNESVIAGTGATNGASNGSANYSAGNPILWCQNSTDPIGGFYSDGAKVYWRAYPLTMGSVPP
ncbi:MAG: hypothetical protein EZS28_014922 [Streblomastix strix]|uniref:Uncharacterized protein n=1 Tax=Streblomastix strix TaxID=222440 RepID=A0A5J4W499_9EUKA|nr:MAG: hypothetical protein EZS28_014922 [Streblomastix strix]